MIYTRSDILCQVRVFSKRTCWIAICLGALVLIWIGIFGITVVDEIVPALASMKPHATLALILSGASLVMTVGVIVMWWTATSVNQVDRRRPTAERTRDEMNQMKSQHEELLRQAREERSMILREAKEAKDAIIGEAREKAKLEAGKAITEAKREIENQKMAALVEVKNQVGNMVIEVSEKVLQRELHEKKDQMRYIDELLDKSKLN